MNRRDVAYALAALWMLGVFAAIVILAIQLIAAEPVFVASVLLVGLTFAAIVILAAGKD